MTKLFYGKNVVKQILLSKTGIHKVYLAGRDESIEKLCAKANVKVISVDRKALTKLVGNPNHQGVAVERDDYKLYTVDEIVEDKKDKYGLIILLDEIEDPHNLGAVLRTADAIGADGVIFKKNNAVGLNPTVAKVSAGAIDRVKCASVTNLTTTAKNLKEKGYWVVGTDMDGQDYRSLDYDFHTVLVIGNEGKGISRLLREQCDYVISLPMKGEIESLNASVSAGILMYSIFSQRFPYKK